jgi:hypothetical protein
MGFRLFIGHDYRGNLDRGYLDIIVYFINKIKWFNICIREESDLENCFCSIKVFFKKPILPMFDVHFVSLPPLLLRGGGFLFAIFLVMHLGR